MACSLKNGSCPLQMIDSALCPIHCVAEVQEVARERVRVEGPPRAGLGLSPVLARPYRDVPTDELLKELYARYDAGLFAAYIQLETPHPQDLLGLARYKLHWDGPALLCAGLALRIGAAIDHIIDATSPDEDDLDDS